MDLITAVVGFSLIGFLVLLFAGKRLGEPGAGWVGTIAATASFAAALALWGVELGRPVAARVVVVRLFTWFRAGGLVAHVAFRVDELTVVMVLFVTGVSALIHLYSIGYMHRDPRFHQFFVYLNLFVFSMTVLVSADNLPLTFLGWEGVGACSYWLISFWFERPAAASAGKKAFIVNRIGDTGFILATALVFAHLHSVSYAVILPEAHRLPSGTLEAVALLFFLAAVGKSAQIPLFVWLLDAMEGPTPVSALIHAATMVTAGVFLMARLSAFVTPAHAAAAVIAAIGAVTAFIAAMAATSQHDIKKIVAYSTVSQLGYMMLGIGTGAYVAALFLMVTHAFYKALIFLGSGSVIHALDGEQDVRRMGALRRLMPITAVTMILAWLSIAGVPPFSGFFSKGSVLEAAFAHQPLLWGLGVVTAVLTAYYMGRLVYVVFYNEPRYQEVLGDRTPHEAPRVMTVPLVILAAAAVLGGIINLPIGRLDFLDRFLGPVFGPALVGVHLSGTARAALLATDAIAGLLGVALAWQLWGHRWRRPELEPAILQQGWYVDATYDRLIAQPATRLAQEADEVIDPKVIDGAVMGVAAAARRLGGLGRVVQSGLVRSYLLIMVAGIVVVMGYVVAVASR